MVTKHGFLITMVISAAVGALILAYSPPTQGAGAGGKGSSSGASKPNISESSKVDTSETSKLDTGETSKTKVYEKENVHRPVKAGETSSKSSVSSGASSVKIPLDAKGQKINADAAIFGNQGAAGKIGTGKSDPTAGATGSGTGKPQAGESGLGKPFAVPGGSMIVDTPGSSNGSGEPRIRTYDQNGNLTKCQGSPCPNNCTPNCVNPPPKH